MERTSTELALFAIAFFGCVVGAAGIALPSAWVAISGFLVLSLSLGGFGLRQFLGE
jgi:hypothetical protein